MIAWISGQPALAVALILYMLFIWMLLLIVLADEMPKARTERRHARDAAKQARLAQADRWRPEHVRAPSSFEQAADQAVALTRDPS